MVGLGSWDGNSAVHSFARLVRPTNTGATILDGYPTGAITYNLDAATNGINNLPEDICEPETVNPVFVFKEQWTG